MHAKIKDGSLVKFPYGMADLQIENPFTNYNGAYDVAAIFPTTEGATVHGQEIVPVTMLPAPEHDQRTQTVELGQPSLTDGEWTVGWIVTNKTQEQLDQANAAQASQVRNDRNAKLAASDWTQLADSTANKAAWATHRQALRDVTKQSGFPWTITWPEQP
jgi:hypothetical protein